MTDKASKRVRRWRPQSPPDKMIVLNRSVQGFLIGVTKDCVVLENDEEIVMVETRKRRVRDGFTKARPRLGAHVTVHATGIALNTRDLERMVTDPRIVPRIQSGCLVVVEPGNVYDPATLLTYPLWKARIESALLERSDKETTRD